MLPAGLPSPSPADPSTGAHRAGSGTGPLWCWCLGKDGGGRLSSWLEDGVPSGFDEVPHGLDGYNVRLARSQVVDLSGAANPGAPPADADWEGNLRAAMRECDPAKADIQSGFCDQNKRILLNVLVQESVLHPDLAVLGWFAAAGCGLTEDARLVVFDMVRDAASCPHNEPVPPTRDDLNDDLYKFHLIPSQQFIVDGTLEARDLPVDDYGALLAAMALVGDATTIRYARLWFKRLGMPEEIHSVSTLRDHWKQWCP